jgi:hypothetical protein
MNCAPPHERCQNRGIEGRRAESFWLRRRQAWRSAAPLVVTRILASELPLRPATLVVSSGARHGLFLEPQRGEIGQPRATPWESSAHSGEGLKGRNKAWFKSG